MSAPENPFEDLAEEIGRMIKFRPPKPEDDNRVAPFELSDEELAYLHGETDAAPNPTLE